MMRYAWTAIALTTGLSLTGQNPYGTWKNGPPTDSAFFPIGVWLQDPRLAPRYKELGINVYVGLWKGPTEAQLATLAKAGMIVIGAQTHAALRFPHREIVRGWSQPDEPDNAQPRKLFGYGPPKEPAAVHALYRELRRKDRTRPIFLNLGQGVANDHWKGRGSRTGHLEDYPEYVKGADIVSFDVYPVVHKDPRVRGRLELVAKGVQRLVQWTKGRQIVWNCIEAAHVRSMALPSPADVRAEVWMSLIHGSRGIIYFVHEWKPKFRAAGLLAHPELMRGVARVNAEVRRLAPVLYAPDTPKVQAQTAPRKVPVACLAKRHRGAIYLFAVGMRRAATKATFRIPGAPRRAEVTVLGENRTLPLRGGRFADSFTPYAVHLYRIGKPRPQKPTKKSEPGTRR